MQLSNKMSAVQALRQMMASERTKIAAALLLATGCSLAEIIPWITLLLASQAIVSGNASAVMSLAAIAIAALIVRYALYITGVWQAHLAAYQIIARVRQYLVASLAKMPANDLNKFHRADLEKRMTDDCQKIEPLVAHHGVDLVNGIIMPLLLTGLLFYVDWRLALVALIPLPIALIIQSIVMKDMPARQLRYNKIVARMHSHQLDFLNAIGVMKLFSLDSSSYRQLDRALNSHNRIIAAYTKTMIGGWIAFVTIAQASILLVVPCALYFAYQGSLSTSHALVSVLIAATILRPWLQLTQLSSEVMATFTAINRLIPLFGSPSQDALPFNQPFSALHSQALSLNRGGRTLFSAFNASLLPGEQVVIRGASGSGKSSLLAVLTGQLKACEGDWYINQQSIAQLSDQDRARYIALVSQQTHFYQGSLQENLCLGAHQPSQSDIWQVLACLEMDKLVKALPNGLETSIGETQRAFSGGEYQRLAIARAMLANTPVLVLDEATAHLDQLTEQKVLKALRQYAPKQVQIIISHRSQSANFAEQIWQIENGQITINALTEAKQHG